MTDKELKEKNIWYWKISFWVWTIALLMIVSFVIYDLLSKEELSILLVVTTLCVFLISYDNAVKGE